MLTSWLGNGAQTVGYSTAQHRANCCLLCPLHTKSGLIESSAADAIKRFVALKNSLNLKVAGEENLSACSVCGCHMPLKIWLPLDKIKREMDALEIARLHPQCWILTEK